MTKSDQLEKLNQDLEKMKEFRRYAQMYGGKIKLGGEIVTIEKIEELIEHLKFEIASFKSNWSDLTIIPKNQN